MDLMELNELYQRYGEMLVKAEILQGQINEIKRQISEQLNKPKEPPK
jgi:hypothetical protein